MKSSDYQPEDDPFLCRCRSCRKFWQLTFKEQAQLLQKSGSIRSNLTAFTASSKHIVKVGSRVLVYGEFPGTVKFVGPKNEDIIAPELYVGIKLDDNVNFQDNGMMDGKWYFDSPRGHGVMVKYTEVVPIKSPEKCPPIKGNFMFPSYEEIRKRRHERSTRLTDRYIAAGVTSPVLSEPGYCPRYESRCTSSQRSVRTPVPTVHINDPKDVAFKDMKKLEEKEMRQEEKKKSILKQIVPEENEMEKLKKHFSGRDNADQLTKTLKKLQNAYEAGVELTNVHSSTCTETSSFI